MEKSGSVCTTLRLTGLDLASVCILFCSLNTVVCRKHRDEVVHPFVAM